MKLSMLESLMIYSTSPHFAASLDKAAYFDASTVDDNVEEIVFEIYTPRGRSAINRVIHEARQNELNGDVRITDNLDRANSHHLRGMVISAAI